MTVTGVLAERGPVAVDTVATTAPEPTRPEAVYVVVGPEAGARLPGVPGASDQTADTGTTFPKTSTP